MSELLPAHIEYSEEDRDAIEARLAVVEVDFATRNGTEFYLYWRKKTNVLSGVIRELTSNTLYVVPIGLDEGRDFMDHPYYYGHRAGKLPSQVVEHGED